MEKILCCERALAEGLRLRQTRQSRNQEGVSSRLRPRIPNENNFALRLRSPDNIPVLEASSS